MTSGGTLRHILKSLVSTVTATAPQWNAPALSYVFESQEEGDETSAPTGLLLLWVRPPPMPGNKDKGQGGLAPNLLRKHCVTPEQPPS